MRALAAELREKIDGICIEYHYFKNENIIEKAKEIIPTIQVLYRIPTGKFLWDQ